VTANQGSLSGSATSILTGTQDIDLNFAEENFSGTGSGTGTVTIAPLRVDGRRLFYQITVELPLAIEENVVIEGSPIAADAAIDGTIKAEGESFIELEDFAAWATELGLATNSQENFDLSPIAPNFIFFALGLDGLALPKQILEFTSAGVMLITGGEVALGDLELQSSRNLQNWARVPESELISGSSLISLGDSLAEPITIRQTAEKTFYRIAIVSPSET